MQLHPDHPNLGNPIQHYDQHSVTVNQQRWEHSLIITPADVTAWDVRHLSELNEEKIHALSQLSADLILIGTGTAPTPVPTPIQHWLHHYLPAVEWMPTQAACRSYMALMSDNRTVAAALIVEPTS